METRHFYSKYAPWILLITAVSLPIVFSSAGKAVKHNKNRVEDWLPSSYVETKHLTWFRKQFVADQFIIVSWPGCRLGSDPTTDSPAATEADDPRIEQLATLLLADDPLSAAQSLQLDTTQFTLPASWQDAKSQGKFPRYFKEVTTARKVLDQLTNEPTSVPYAEAVERLNGSLIGPDGHQTCLVVSLTEEGANHLRDAIGRGQGGRRLIRRPPGDLFHRLALAGLTPDDVRLGGPPVDNVSIDEEGERTLIRLSGLAGLLGITLCYWSLRSVRLTAIVFATGILSGALGLAIVWQTGNSTDAVLMSMPSLVYVLAISGSVHLINHYREALAETGPEGAVDKALAHGWKPALLCSITTALGLGSLCTSELTPIRKFGIYSAAGVMGMMLVLFLFLPAALELWHKKRLVQADKRAADRRAKDRLQRIVDQAASHQDNPTYHTNDHLNRFWQMVGRFVIRNHALVACSCCVFIGVVSVGVQRLDTSIDLLKLFDRNARILKDYAWLEENLGRLVPMEIVLRFPTDGMAHGDEPADAAKNAGRLNFLDRLEATSLVEKSIEMQFGTKGSNIVGRTMSAATFAPTDPGRQEGPQVLRFARRQAANKQLEQNRTAFQDSGFLGIDPKDQSELWRVSLRVAAFRDVDYGVFVHDLRDAVEPVMAAIETRSAVLHHIAKHRDNGGHSGANVWMLVEKAPAAGAIIEAAPQTAAAGPALGGFTWPWRKPKATAINIPGTTRKTYQAAVNHLLKRSQVNVRWIEVTDANREEITHQAQQGADCVVWLGAHSANTLALVATQNQQPGPATVDAEAILRHRMDPNRIPMTETVATTSTGNTNAVAPPVAADAVYTGVVPIVYKAQRELLNSLIESTIWSFITITPLMMFVARGIRSGLIVMIPNALPILVVFGGMGWLGAKVDIGSMMSASIALGVAVDDTIHFLTWFREELRRTSDRRQALLTTYRLCASPTLQAAMISGLGLSIFALSTFTPTQKFGWLMLTILLAGVVSELIMLPAILAGPIGSIFRSGTSQDEQGFLSRILASFKSTPSVREAAVKRPHVAESTSASRYH